MIGWEDYYSRDIFRVEEFLLQRPDWWIVRCNGLLYIFPTLNIVNFLVNFTVLAAIYFSIGTTYHICAESAVKPQAIDQFSHLLRVAYS